MRAILGIGNPGSKYDKTKHNIGFQILDEFAQKHKISYSPSKGEYYLAGGVLNTSPFFLIRPTTYVNLSGIAASHFIKEHDIDFNDLLVVTDDLNLSLGKIRLRQAGGDGGHNGIKSIIYHLESDTFPRLRFGIGNDFENGEMADFVLSKFNGESNRIVRPSIDFSVSLLEEFIQGGLQAALNFYSKESQKLNNSSNNKTSEGI